MININYSATQLCQAREIRLGWFYLLPFALVFIGCGETDPKVEPIPNSVLISNVSIVDTAEGQLLTNRDIFIVEGRIAEVTDAGDVDAKRANLVIEGDGLFVMPGLIDVHAHIGDGGLEEQTSEVRTTALEQFVRYGVTSVFVPGGGGGNEDWLRVWKSSKASNRILAPRLFGSGTIITAPGSHPIGTLFGMPDDVDPKLAYDRGAVPFATNDDADALIDEKKAHGVDAIKIAIEDGPTPWYPRPRLSNEQIAALVKAAHARDLPVYAHVSLAQHVADGVSQGIDGIMHSSEEPLSETLLVEMADKGVFYVATLALYDGFFRQVAQEPNLDTFMLNGVSKTARMSLEKANWWTTPQDDVAWVEPTRRALKENLLGCIKHGVPLALGTDVNNPGVFPGYSAHQELSLLVDAGLTPAQALHAATVGSATFLGRESELGRVEIGYAADLLLLAKNPLETITATRSLKKVIFHGQVVEDVISLDP